ncbi:hypothetical protein SELMODRAFT_420999 [Selaginella moellendorffii]|uniref:ABC1 atypical kinase-like domain-containing protein n=1 Tax=Selaginella moellendorffii TaxID=88036 RepID=D8SDT8_SELML|nr:probable serine/threonine-protein kinase abkC [Selaginella moellendorffii]EFJ17307.1 hypothetical protein SELMODRAFT_420999 [Selaginella moellendorffii]|eukprot:XP_002981492.1 probable serine/threonine-protein kinase abkC [Selaginella moellendorffii]
MNRLFSGAARAACERRACHRTWSNSSFSRIGYGHHHYGTLSQEAAASPLQVLSRNLARHGGNRIVFGFSRTGVEFKDGWKKKGTGFAGWKLGRGTGRAWKNSWLGRCYYHHPLWKVVGTMSLAVVRSQFSPRIAAFLVGEATLMRRLVAESEAPTCVPLSYHSDIQPSYVLWIFSSLVEGMMLLLRALYLVVVFAPALAVAPFADPSDAKLRLFWLELFHSSLERAGAAFIKWGQWAATRPDLFPKDVCETLSKLHSKAPAHSFSQTRKTVEGAFGKRIEELFEDFEEEPLASGSVAQVHRAVLRGQGKKPVTVAVKVRHPGVTEVIRRDFILINWVVKACNHFSGLRYLRLEDSVQQFAVFMLTQVDLAREAAHLSRFLYNFRSWKDVSFPKPLYPLVHPAVLVETYERGESVSRFVDSPKRSHINSALAHIGTHTLLKMLLVDNFIHADLHPGNILVRMERFNPVPGKGLFRSHPHLVFLDVGMTAELSNKDRRTLLEFFKGIAMRDGRKTAECALQFSELQTCPDPKGFVREVEDCFKDWNAMDSAVLHTGDCIQELLERVRRHKVNIDGDVCTVIVTTLVLEGWQRKLDPEYNIMETLQSLVLQSNMATSLSYTIDSIMAP